MALTQAQIDETRKQIAQLRDPNNKLYNPDQANAYEKNLGNYGQIEQETMQNRTNNPQDVLYKAPAAPKPTAPTMPQINPFTAPQYNYMSYDQAKGQAGDRLNPEYAMKLQEALTNVKNQAMGSGFYGQLPTVQYSADTSGQIEAQKQSSIAQLAQQLKDADYQRGEREYDKAFQLWGANNDIAYKNYDIGYNDYRNQVGDSNRLEDIARDERWRNVDNGWKSREWNRQTEQDKYAQSKDARDFAEQQRQFNMQYALSAAKSSGGGGSRGGSSGGGRRSSGGGSRSSGGSSGGYINLGKTLASGYKYFDSLPGDKYNSNGQKVQNGVGTATKAALKNEFNQALQRYAGPNGYAQFQAEKNAIRKAQPDTADYLINAIEGAFAYRK